MSTNFNLVIYTIVSVLFLVILFGIKLQLQTKKKLDKQELLWDKYRMFVDSVNQVIFQTNLKGDIIFLNKEWENYSKHIVSDCIGRNLAEFVYPPDQGKVDFISSYKDIQGIYNKEIRIIGENKKIIWMSLRARVIDSDQGISIIGTLADITERKNMELELEGDLKIAKAVQKSILTPPISNDEIEIEAIFHPSENLSGDMYSWFQISDKKYGIILIDVMGHGVSSSLLCMSMASLLRGVITKAKEPETVINELTRHASNLLFHSPEFKFYFTCMYVTIDLEEREIEYINAGHPAGLVVSNNKVNKTLNKGGLPIGIIPNLTYEKEKLPYSESTKILLFTDGILEKYESSIQAFSEDIERYYKDTIHFSNKGLLKNIQENMIINDNEQVDDICVISIHIK